MPRAAWQPQQTKIIQDPEWLWKTGSTTPSWGFTDYEQMYGPPSELGYTGEGAPEFEEPKKRPEPELKSWEKWQPYFEGLGIRTQPSGEMTATSPAFRERMLPEALQAMMDYYESLGKPWEDYLGYSAGFMPKTPNIGMRRWTPSYNWRR